jgi:hypothetical protein
MTLLTKRSKLPIKLSVVQPEDMLEFVGSSLQVPHLIFELISLYANRLRVN